MRRTGLACRHRMDRASRPWPDGGRRAGSRRDPRGTLCASSIGRHARRSSCGAASHFRPPKRVVSSLLVRLAGPLHGVTFRTALPASQRASSPWEIVDCRLALSLDRLRGAARHARRRRSRPLLHVPPSAGPLAYRKDRGRGTFGGLAIDAASFVKRDGHTLDVQRDFHGRIGARTCGPGTMPPHPRPEASELRQIVCEDAADAKLFNVELTPDYNWAHRNHFHLRGDGGRSLVSRALTTPRRRRGAQFHGRQAPVI